ncbi:MAG: co-chaperone GroES [Euryarchaeota archaeon]|nr:co-chaperone GroES [Euryarchaeota archaeon]
MAKIELLGNRILLKRFRMPEKTDGGIYLPDDARLKTELAEVIEISPIITKIAIGDIVLVGRYTGVEVEIEKQDYTIVCEEDIIGKVKQNG